MEFFKKLFEKKDKKVLINLFTALAVGVGLILIGGMFDGNNSKAEKETEKVAQKEESTKEEDDEKRLESILKGVEGVGRVQVMIMYKNSGEDITAEDIIKEESKSESENKLKEEHKTLLTDENMPYIISKEKPEVEGILISCEGGGNVEVKSKLISACEALFGIDANKIEVLKMGGQKE